MFMRPSLFSKAFFLFLAPVLLLAAGCSGGKKKVDIDGTVNVDGKALPAGSITFTNNPEKAKDKISVTAEIEDGAYTAKGLVPGEYKVQVSVEQLRMKVAELPQKRQALQGVDAQIAKGVEMAGKMGKEFDAADLRAQVQTMKDEIKKLEALQKKLPPKLPEKYAKESDTPLKVTVPAGGGTVETVNVTAK